jgi:hypothetical protein
VAEEELWQEYPTFKRPIIPHEFIDAFKPRLREMGFSTVRITGELDPFTEEFEAKVTVIKRAARALGGRRVFYDAHVATFTLQQLPGCGGVLLSHNSYVTLGEQGKGVGSFLQEMKMWIAAKLEAGMLLATVTCGNTAEEGLLEKHGWFRLGLPFRNVHTENKVQLWRRMLT